MRKITTGKRIRAPRIAALAGALLGALAPGRAAPLAATLAPPPPAESAYFKTGTTKTPLGAELTIDSRSLRLNGEPFIPAMGEFHYSRYPESEWREELLKRKAGGIGIVATYVFWIHHEEIPGKWDWSGSRNLRGFVQAAQDVGLRVVVRLGPWCHGEVRNGGLPDWLQLRTDLRLRSTDEKFLALVRGLYGQAARQLEGLLWKDGGPVIGVQLDNEYRGPAEYLLALKKIARDCGLDVPLYTRTGWPSLTTPMPVGEIVPLFGVYAEGFWDRELTAMPGRYWAGFHFSALRTDAAIATEMLGNRAAHDEADVTKYPYLTCEIGGGMMNSYHRRILVDPRDVESTTLIKLASGSTLPGYYMYHGGTNPAGKLTTLMEAQTTPGTNYNDLPVKSYDFQAPLGEFGQVRPHYHWLRRLHLFLEDCGGPLAGMAVALPEKRPAGKDDIATLRWAARADGQRGFVFFNNYERGRELPAKTEVQFALRLADGGTLVLPSQPVTIAAGAFGCWPFNLEVNGLTFTHATAQPISHILEPNGTLTLFFAATPGVPAEFALRDQGIGQVMTPAPVQRSGGQILVREVPTGHGVALRIIRENGAATQVVLLDERDSLAFWKGSLGGRDRAVLTRANIVFDEGAMRATASEPATVSLFPEPEELRIDEAIVAGLKDGVFTRYRLPVAATPPREVEFELEHAAGEPPPVRLGPIRQAVAMQPGEGEFTTAAVWRVKLPPKIDPASDPILRFHYVGDVARLTLGDRLLTDDFYNGNPLELGLRRFAPESLRASVRIAVLPLRKDAPIFMAESARPDFGLGASQVTLRKVELVQSATVTLTAR
jgi:hypothetical protein